MRNAILTIVNGMQIKLKNLEEPKVPVVFGPESNPKEFRIDLLEEALKRLSFGTIDHNELELEIGDKLADRPYSDTGRATMPPDYLCEGSVWLNFYDAGEGSYANISLVPHLDETGHKDDLHPHHNFYLYWTDFDGTLGVAKDIPGHIIPVNEPIIISVSCGQKTCKGTIRITH